MTTAETTTRPTMSEISESLSGFDEIAIARHFDGFDPYAGAERKPILMLRALVFVHRRREGDRDADAYKAAMEMSLREANGYFAADPDEIEPDEPETPEGKEPSPVG